MATNFPTSLDTFVNPAAANQLNSPSHSGQHDNINDAMAAVQAKLGVNNSAVPSSIDYKMTRCNQNILTVTTDTTLDTSYSTVLCFNSSPITINLPAAASVAGQCYTIRKIQATAANTVTIDGSGIEKIDGQNTIVLYLLYDSITIQSDGTGWQIISDNRKAHTTRLRRNTTQAIAGTGAAVQVQFDTVDFDEAALADVTTNFDITIKRAGKYGFHAAWQSGGSPTVHQCWIYLNGSAVENDVMTQSVGATMSNQVTFTFPLAVGDKITLRVAQNTGSNQNTTTTTGQQPRLEMWEIRP